MLIKVNFISPSGEITKSIDFNAPKTREKILKPHKAFKIVRNDILAGKPSTIFIEALATISHKHLKRAWIIASEHNLRNTDFSCLFRTEWTTRSHLIREAFADDNLLKAVLWNVLPPYRGNDLIIWRGEQTARFNAGIIGFNWSTDKNSADIFASGLCTTYSGGGILLKAKVSAKGVISGYGNHTIDPSEKGIVVDPEHIIEIEEIAIYPEGGIDEHN
ncbi:hypothetical protein [Acetobacter orleanensis]|uniref:Uncharacterized protein n=1 Tax=Acetobacter orleanensis TaxID=104099 RepID=A0A4Y3TRR1_9PROT|nr:hypothetical protein [Acetobacter orleanensis]PCD78257.1 hypothetical protein CO710_13255 [Acetobacter orleanensis]GAN69843.1 hypothetical protein Abol_085_003 [Acetobacter orleanensis JCM 7639]GBR25647.1 hypothetical protein AA0473_0947 [Acetobacter orleanensis NRIC 0473]GEB84169.1 hypothetical protein AOR01nite_26460 [Acetobacter orleanensis]